MLHEPLNFKPLIHFVNFNIDLFYLSIFLIHYIH